MVELINKRNLNSKTFDTGRTQLNADGVTERVIYGTKLQNGLHYAENGQYKNVDTNIKVNAKYEFSHEVTKMRGIVRFGDTSANTKKHLFGVEDDNGNWLNVKLDLENYAALIINDNKAEFPGAGHCQVNHYVLYSGVKTEYLIFNKAVNSLTVTFKHNDEITPEQRGNTIVFTRDGKDIFTVEAPFAYDAAVGINVTEPVVMTLGMTEGFHSATMVVDAAWLLAATSPIIDPDVTIDDDSGTLEDTFMNVFNPTINYGANATIHIKDWAAQEKLSTLLYVDLSGEPGGTVLNGRFGLDIYSTIGTVNWQAFKVLVSWGEGDNVDSAADSGESSWNTRESPTTWNTSGCKGSGTDRAIASDSTGVMTVPSSDYHIDLLAATIQDWIDNPATNFGELIEGQGGDTSSQANARSSETAEGNKPYLYYEYTGDDSESFFFFFGGGSHE